MKLCDFKASANCYKVRLLGAQLGLDPLSTRSSSLIDRRPGQLVALT